MFVLQCVCRLICQKNYQNIVLMPIIHLEGHQNYLLCTINPHYVIVFYTTKGLVLLGRISFVCFFSYSEHAFIIIVISIIFIITIITFWIFTFFWLSSLVSNPESISAQTGSGQTKTSAALSVFWIVIF